MKILLFDDHRRATFDTLSALAPKQFLSTLSLRRATFNIGFSFRLLFNFYPRSPCGERLFNAVQIVIIVMISIHALLAESDRINRNITNGQSHFYPRSPCGERPSFGGHIRSIRYFYPRSPCGERPASGFLIGSRSQISIHALLAESDLFLKHHIFFHHHFYPRSPCGERRLVGVGGLNNHIISIHALLAESDPQTNSQTRTTAHFYPRSPCGERRNGQRVGRKSQNFYPRSPCGERLMDTLILANAVLFLSTLSLRRATVGAP